MGGGRSGEVVVVDVAEVVLFRRCRPELVELKSSRHGKDSSGVLIGCKSPVISL